MFNKKLYFFCFLFSISIPISAQQSLDIYGGFSKLVNSKFRLNSFESNVMNYNNTIDWEFGFTGSLVFSEQVNNISQLAFIGKRIKDHYFYIRYTPGFQKEFTINTDSLVTINDSANVLNANLKYSERFGFGYSYTLSDKITIGTTFRYFEENYSEENVFFHFSDSVNSFYTDFETWSKTYWRGDFGVTYQPWDNLLFSFSSANLLILNPSGEFDKNKNLELRTNIIGILGIDFSPLPNLFLKANLETTSSFVVGADYQSSFSNGNLLFGVSIFHDKYQSKFIAGVQPMASFSYRAFSLNLSAIIYSQKRSTKMGVNNLLSDGIHDITNNQFSFNQFTAALNLALNFTQPQKIKFIDLKITSQIFPTMAEEYINIPFAVAKVQNLTDEKLTIKPASFCPDFNDDVIYSPSVEVSPKDSAEVKFFTVISDVGEYNKGKKIGNVSFYLSTKKNNNEDEFQNPILINGPNSWNSDVRTLRYFVNADYTEANKYAKKILNRHKQELQKTDSRINKFAQIRILFNSFIKEMQYVSDPRTSSEFVQFPTETFEVKGGDCDDLSVAFSSILESVGIETAFVDFKSESGVSHVNLLANTTLKPEEAILISGNDKKYFIRKNLKGEDEVWIPLEMTSLTDFNKSWEVGSEKFNKDAIDNLGLVKGRVSIYDIY